MFPALNNHPFAVEAYFESSLVLTFAIPKEDLQSLIPPCLELDTLNDSWAFIAVAMVKAKELRPRGFPKFLGNNFFLIGYRIFVRYHSRSGKNLRGLYILKSLTDKKRMTLFGNIFTNYNYSTTSVNQSKQGNNIQIKSISLDFQVEIASHREEVPLPERSPFADWQQARRFAGPLPFTFSYDAKKKEVLLVEGVRQNWKPEPVQVLHHHFSFLNAQHFRKMVLANAFVIHNIPYYWKRGVTEQWKP